MGNLHDYPMYIYDSISLNYFENEKYFRHKLQRKSKQISRSVPFFPRIVSFTR